MRTHNKIAFALTSLLILASCDQYCDMTTIVNRDGTCSREISLHLDSTQLVSGKINEQENIVSIPKGYTLTWTLEGDTLRHAFPVPRSVYDSLQTQRGDTGKAVTQRVIVHARAIYNNVEDMAAHTLLTPDSLRIIPQARLKKQFRWFRTAYQFTETYPQQKIVFPVAPTKYLTEAELGYWTKGEPNLTEGLSGREADELADSIKHKLSQWLNDNYFEGLYQVVLRHYGELSKAPMSRETFIARHDSIRNAFLKYQDNDVESLADISSITWYKVFGSTSYSDLLNEHEDEVFNIAGFDRLQALRSLDISYQLLLPGIEEPLRYRLSGDRLLMGPYTISAYSSMPNLWAYIVTALVILLAVVSLIVRRKVN